MQQIKRAHTVGVSPHTPNWIIARLQDGAYRPNPSAITIDLPKNP